MEDGNDIRKELREWNSPLSQHSRKLPFAADESYLNALPEQLNELAQHSANAPRIRNGRQIVFPVWVKRSAAVLILGLALFGAQHWLRPNDPERKLARELHKVDVPSIEAYLEQGGLDANRYSTKPEIPDEMAEALADLEPADIREYLNQYPLSELQAN